MSPPGLLPERLFRGAINVSNIITGHKGYSILIGGAALMVHGMEGRSTKDLDISLSHFDTQLHESFLANNITVRLNAMRPTNFKFKDNYDSPPGSHQAVKIDFAVDPETKALARYTIKMEDITVANLSLLLVKKIITSTERHLLPKASKVKADFDDILFCLGALTEKGNPKVPNDEILRYRLSEGVWGEFWVRLAEHRRELSPEVHRRLLRRVGLP